MNIMEDVAHKLGVEIGEIFGINFGDGKYKFENGDIWSWDNRYEIWKPVLYDTVAKLLNGRYEIRKIDNVPISRYTGVRDIYTGVEDVKKGQKIYPFCEDPYISPYDSELEFNEFTDEKVKNDLERVIEIYKRLAKAASKFNTEPIDRNNNSQKKWFIYYDSSDGGALVSGFAFTTNGYNIYFTSKEAADKAIDMVGKDDLIWLFTEFEPYKGYYPSTKNASEACENDIK